MCLRFITKRGGIRVYACTDTPQIGPTYWKWGLFWRFDDNIRSIGYGVKIRDKSCPVRDTKKRAQIRDVPANTGQLATLNTPIMCPIRVYLVLKAWKLRDRPIQAMTKINFPFSISCRYTSMICFVGVSKCVWSQTMWSCGLKDPQSLGPGRTDNSIVF